MKRQVSWSRDFSLIITIVLLLTAAILTGCGLVEGDLEYTPEPGADGLGSSAQSALSTVGPEATATSASGDATTGVESGAETLEWNGS